MKRKKEGKCNKENSNYKFQDYFEKNLLKKLSTSKKSKKNKNSFFDDSDKFEKLKFIEDPFMIDDGVIQEVDTTFEKENSKNFMNGTDKFNLEEFNIDGVKEGNIEKIEKKLNLKIFLIFRI